jgi:hypothetical protein
VQDEQRYRFLLSFLLDRGVLHRHDNGAWRLRGIYGVDDSGLKGAGRTPEEALDNAIVAVNLDPTAAAKFWRESCERVLATPAAPVAAPDECPCSKCIDARGVMSIFNSWMVLCPTCGNKRCPHATDHDLACTNSNEPGQPGSSYGTPIAPADEQKRGDLAGLKRLHLWSTSNDGHYQTEWYYRAADVQALLAAPTEQNPLVLRLKGRMIEVGNLDGGHDIGFSINIGDGKHASLTGLSQHQARALAPLYQCDVEITVTPKQ